MERRFWIVEERHQRVDGVFGVGLPQMRICGGVVEVGSMNQEWRLMVILVVGGWRWGEEFGVWQVRRVNCM